MSFYISVCSILREISSYTHPPDTVKTPPRSHPPQPGLFCYTVLDQIKKNPKTIDIPVIILSNLGQKDDVERGISLGAKDYLVKAYLTPSEVVDKVREVIG